MARRGDAVFRRITLRSFTATECEDGAAFVSQQRERQKISPDWWRKILAGAVLGFLFSVGLSGLFAWLGPGGISAPEKTQFAMWSIAPVWMLMFSFVFLFKSGNRALLWFGGANVLVFSLLFLVYSIMVTL
ncbi:hypothetical protein [Teredinibacter haidensis]|uniref:hypothetical protein n=1 Tax=Teredinibacter haidensis TaxID=2731755 RepID=UPI001FE96A39|nr:hypothetical protein [Teredinibacter haidensis]